MSQPVATPTVADYQQTSHEGVSFPPRHTRNTPITWVVNNLLTFIPT